MTKEHPIKQWRTKRPNAKLKPYQVELIRGSKMTIGELADIFNVSRMAISYIKRGKTWK